LGVSTGDWGVQHADKVRVRVRVWVEVWASVSGNTFKYVFGQTSIQVSVVDP